MPLFILLIAQYWSVENSVMFTGLWLKRSWGPLL